MHAGIGPALHRTLRLNQRDREVSKGRASVYFKIRTKVIGDREAGTTESGNGEGVQPDQTSSLRPGLYIPFGGSFHDPILVCHGYFHDLIWMVKVISMTLFGLPRLFP